MDLEKEFKKYYHEFDLGGIESDIKLISSGTSLQTIISFTFRNYSKFLKIHFHYSHKNENFSLNLIKYAGCGSSEEEWLAINNINKISMWEFSKFPKMSVADCFGMVEKLIQGQKDSLDPILLDKNLQIYMKLLDINKEFK